jgi:hypothetical protein
MASWDNGIRELIKELQAVLNTFLSADDELLVQSSEDRLQNSIHNLHN